MTSLRTSSSPLIFAIYLAGENAGQTIDETRLAEALEDPDPVWFNMHGLHKDARGLLERLLPTVDPIIVDALLAEETRPRFDQFDDSTLVMLRAANLNEGAQPHDMLSIRLWADAGRIVTVQRHRILALLDVCERVETGHGPATTAGLIAALGLRLVERIEPVLIDLDEAADDIEEAVVEAPDRELRHGIIEVRKQAILFRRYMAPQRDVLLRMRTSDLSWIDERHRLRVHEAQDRLTRLIEDLDAVRERAQIVSDELANNLADRMNKKMYVLAIVAAIFLPLSFLTGLLGINVAGIPGSENTWAFLIVVGMLTAIGGALLYYFRSRDWF